MTHVTSRPAFTISASVAAVHVTLSWLSITPRHTPRPPPAPHAASDGAPAGGLGPGPGSAAGTKATVQQWPGRRPRSRRVTDSHASGSRGTCAPPAGA